MRQTDSANPPRYATKAALIPQVDTLPSGDTQDQLWRRWIETFAASVRHLERSPASHPREDPPRRAWTSFLTVLRADTVKETHLDGAETPLYDCICDLDLGKDTNLDPPPYVHLSDNEVGRMYLLVSTGYRSLEYVSNKWPHVFDLNGAIWRHREP